LSREAGVDDIGRSPSTGGDSERRHGLFDTAANDSDHPETDDQYLDGDDDDGFDDGGFDTGGDDNA
jgi:hypothetical protein